MDGRGRPAAAALASTAIVLSFAPRLASTSARAAAPSRARRTGSPISDSAARARASSSQPARAAPLATKRRRSRGSSPCAGRTRSACRTPPARARCGRRSPRGCRRRTPPSRSGRSCASSPIVSSTTMSARGSASMAQFAAAGGLPAFAAGQLLHFGETLGMARRQHQQRVRRRARARGGTRAAPALLALHRAAGDDHRPRCGRAGNSAARGRGRGRQRPSTTDPASRTSGCR